MISAVEEVSTGEVKTGSAGIQLVASALGSCIGLVAYDASRRVGGIAHIMLPGSCVQPDDVYRLRYAEDAVDELLRKMSSLGTKAENIGVVLAGAANVLCRPDDTICCRNISSTLEILHRKNLTVMARSLGGSLRRRVRIDLARGAVFCSVGDNREELLWSFS